MAYSSVGGWLDGWREIHTLCNASEDDDHDDGEDDGGDDRPTLKMIRCSSKFISQEIFTLGMNARDT